MINIVIVNIVIVSSTLQKFLGKGISSSLKRNFCLKTDMYFCHGLSVLPSQAD